MVWRPPGQTDAWAEFYATPLLCTIMAVAYRLSATKTRARQPGGGRRNDREPQLLGHVLVLCARFTLHVYITTFIQTPARRLGFYIQVWCVFLRYVWSRPGAIRRNMARPGAPVGNNDIPQTRTPPNTHTHIIEGPMCSSFEAIKWRKAMFSST